MAKSSALEGLGFGYKHAALGAGLPAVDDYAATVIVGVARLKHLTAVVVVGA